MPSSGTNDTPPFVKIAIQMAGQEGRLTTIDQAKSLQSNMQDFLQAWSITEPITNYQLEWDGPERNVVTEQNMSEIRDGAMLIINPSPTKEIGDLLHQLRLSQSKDCPVTPAAGQQQASDAQHHQLESSQKNRLEAYEQLSKYCSDHALAAEFIAQGGVQLLMQDVERCDQPKDWLSPVFELFIDVLNQQLIEWDCLSQKFVQCVLQTVNGLSSQAPPLDKRLLVNSLIILESVLLNSSQTDSIVSKISSELTLPNLLVYVQLLEQEHEISFQYNCFSLINVMLARSDLLRRKQIVRTLASKQCRQIILNHVLNRPLSSIEPDLASQLYCFQCNLLSPHAERRYRVNEQEAIAIIDELCKIAFENELSLTANSNGQQSANLRYANSSLATGSLGVNLTSSIATSNLDTSINGQSSLISLNNSLSSEKQTVNCTRLGFANIDNPLQDFQTEPCLLSLDLMLYFATNHTDNYVKVVLENCSRSDKEHECPFVRSSIEITKLLLSIIRIGLEHKEINEETDETPTEVEQFHKLFFMHDHPLEELFSICVPLLNKTWKEMRATVEDFDKVFSVLRQQIVEAFRSQDDTCSFDQLRKRLSSLSYQEILNIWQKEKIDREQWEYNAESIRELKSRVRPGLLDVVRQHRLQFLTDGTRFCKYSNKGQRLKDKYWFCRLSNKSKVFFYGDCQDDQIPSIEHLPHKLPVVDIRSLVTGRDCPHMRDQKSKKSTFQLAFSLLIKDEAESSLNFVAPDEKTFAYWQDGLNVLLGQEMTSKEVEQEIDVLMSMEMKLKLLAISGHHIPNHPPSPPEPISNYDFHISPITEPMINF